MSKEKLIIISMLSFFLLNILLLAISFTDAIISIKTEKNATVSTDEDTIYQGTQLSDAEYLNVVAQINQNLLSDKNPGPENVISIVNACIARVPTETQANELAISYLSAVIKYSVYLTDYITANNDLVLETAKKYNLSNKETVNTDNAMLNAMVGEIYRYPYTIVVDEYGVYLNLNYAEIAEQYKQYISPHLYEYFVTFDTEYRRNMFNYMDGILNIDALLSRLELLSDGISAAESDLDTAAVMYKLAYGDTLAHISGLSHEGFQDGTNESTGYPKMSENIKHRIETHMKETSDKRIQNDLSIVLEALAIGSNSYNEESVAILYGLCNFYDYQYGEPYMDKTGLFSISQFNSAAGNPVRALRTIYEKYIELPYADYGKTANNALLLEYENYYLYTIQDEEPVTDSNDPLDILKRHLETSQ